MNHYIPVLTTPAGQCLTAENWGEVGVETVSLALDSLLFKPGYTFLTTLPSLYDYIGWHQSIVLDASLLQAARNQNYTLRSPYDGSTIHHTEDEIVHLIEVLQPEIVLLPPGFHTEFSSGKTRPFFLISDHPSNHPTSGVYWRYVKGDAWSDVVAQLQAYATRPRYVAGDLGLEEMQALKGLGVQYIQSDLPAAEALQGKVYTKTGLCQLNLDKIPHATDFSPIDTSCNCPTCVQFLTKAYLQHLFVHTPLLCHRFLIQHNVHFCQETFVPHQNEFS